MTDANEDFLFSRLPWREAGSDTRSPFWIADLETSPANTIALWVRDRSDATLRQANELFDVIVNGLEEISNRLRELLLKRLAAHEDGGEEGGSEVGGASATEVSRPDADLFRIAFDSGSQATLSFKVRLFGRDFIVAMPHSLDGPPASVIRISVEEETLGPFELVDLKSARERSYSRPAYAAYFIPSGYVWNGSRMILSPLPGVRDRSHHARFRDAIDALPTLLDRAKHSAVRDPTQLLNSIVDHLLDQEVSGPWWSYDLRHELRDEEDEDEDESADPEDDEESQLDAARRRRLADILPFSGPPEVLLFADGSALVSCAHRTSFKSDVYVIESELGPDGQFMNSDVRLVYECE